MSNQTLVYLLISQLWVIAILLTDAESVVAIGNGVVWFIAAVVAWFCEPLPRRKGGEG